MRSRSHTACLKQTIELGALKSRLMPRADFALDRAGRELEALCAEDLRERDAGALAVGGEKQLGETGAPQLGRGRRRRERTVMNAATDVSANGVTGNAKEDCRATNAGPFCTKVPKLLHGLRRKSVHTP
jgi:hypothetical protein